MKSYWEQILIRTTLNQQRKRTDGRQSDISKRELVKGYQDIKIKLRHMFKNTLLITIGIFSAAFGIKGFLLSNNFIDGGATGISLLISELTGTPLYLLILLVNIPFFALAYKVMGRQFALKTILSIGGLAFVLATFSFPFVTSDNLLVAVFGGFFLGAGIGFAIRGGAVIDGTEVLAIFLSRKLGATIGDIIIAINVLIFSAAVYLLGTEIALYSMITYLAASKTLDFIIEGIEEYIGVTIVSGHNEEIREMINSKMGRGVTVYTGKKGFGKREEIMDVEIIYSVITRLELNKLTTEIERIDPMAFVVMNSVKDTRGGMIKQRPLKH